MRWKNVTDAFTERERHYNGKYLEICEVYGDKLEVSLFRAQEELDEIYMSFGLFYGIIYVEKEKATTLRQEIKKELVKEYHDNREPSDDFINSFAEKYKVCLPSDIIINMEF